MTLAATRAAGRIRPVVVTGGAGFIGSNLADRLACDGIDTLIIDSLARQGADENLAWLKRRHPAKITAVKADIADAGTRDAILNCAAVVHLAAQVAVTTSILEPMEDFRTNLAGTLNLLEAARACASPPPFLYASTNKVYGDLSGIEITQVIDRHLPADVLVRTHGISERQPLAFHTPYGCSKGAADQYVLDYARTYRIPAAVFRMSCVYGPRQWGTEDQGWVAHFLMRALDRKPITIFGDGRQVRDILYVGDCVEAYVRALAHIEKVQGRAFNVGGGPANAVSLHDVLGEIGVILGFVPEVAFAGWRPGDQRYYVSDTRAISRALELPQPLPWRQGLVRLAEWLRERRTTSTATRPHLTEGVP